MLKITYATVAGMFRVKTGLSYSGLAAKQLRIPHWIYPRLLDKTEEEKRAELRCKGGLPKMYILSGE